ncbi:putative C-type lectin domain family 20 member A isoform X2 [Hemibagrus wyckioides]|uniref:putative C-type lectin domain family 20 member A isoform X2 n=1 Tax=Hemibagrus wyckioides TaxID=337641 RepID=UPI00266B49DC|nr:putative C-type lectin domain family 20 member A isoform X2 [Hemibagrus wyckioides]
MEQHLFLLLFLTGVVPLVLSDTRQYFLIQQGKTWSDAQAYCQDKYKDLAIIKTSADMVQLQNEAQRQQFTSSAWIGMYNDINGWKWSLGYEPVGSMRLWGIWQPDNWQGKESCGGMNGGTWHDRQCTDQVPFVCFDDTKTGNQKYIYISTHMTWSAAQAYCRTYYTDLASARDATANSIIAGLISGMTWFGLFRETWKWVDHKNVSTVTWMTGEPNNAQGNENCVYLNNGLAADSQCSALMPFFCYEVTRKQQIIRLKIQSSQDVNDTAIKETILEQIKNKLKDHGMAENITVKWRD